MLAASTSAIPSLLFEISCHFGSFANAVDVVKTVAAMKLAKDLRLLGAIDLHSNIK
jgi:hypothetical protein